MLGHSIDYFILKPFTHSHNKATEVQLNTEAGQWQINLETSLRRLDKLQNRFEGRFPIRPGLRYLDVGCGKGDIPIALAKRGAENVTGVDLVERYIVSAKANAARLQVGHRVKFICEEIHRWIPPHKFDVILSHEALEHIENPKAFLLKLADFLAPGGIAVLAFGPLFYSPVGGPHGRFLPDLHPLARSAFFRTGYPAPAQRMLQAGGPSHFTARHHGTS